MAQNNFSSVVGHDDQNGCFSRIKRVLKELGGRKQDNSGKKNQSNFSLVKLDAGKALVASEDYDPYLMNNNSDKEVCRVLGLANELICKIPPKHYDRLKSYNLILETQLNAGLLQEALSTLKVIGDSRFEDTPDNKKTDEAYGFFAVYYGRRGEYDKAFNEMRKINSPERYSVVAHSIAKILREKNQVARLKNFCSDLLIFAREISNEILRSYEYVNLIILLSLMGEKSEREKIFLEYCDFAKKRIHQGVMYSHDELFSKDDSFLYLICALITTVGDHEFALRVCRAIDHEEGYLCYEKYSSLHLAKNGVFGEKYKKRTDIDLLCALARKGDFNQIKKTFKVNQETPNIGDLEKIAKTLLESGYIDESMEMVSIFYDDGWHKNGKSKIYLDMGLTMVRLGELTKANYCFQQAWEAVTKNVFRNHFGRGCCDVVWTLAKLENFKRATTLLDEISDNHFYSYGLTDFVKIYLGYVNQVIKTRYLLDK